MMILTQLRNYENKSGSLEVDGCQSFKGHAIEN